MASLREDKKLAKFFMTDKQPSKRLKSAFKFCSTSTPSNITFFFREKASAVSGGSGLDHLPSRAASHA